MNSRTWFFHMLKNSISQRKGRVFVASLSVAIATGVIVSAVSLSTGIRQKLGGELKAYGANIIASKAEGYIDGEILNMLKNVEGIEDYSGQLYQRASVNGMDVELIGLDMKKTAGLKIIGRPPAEAELIAGADIRDALKLKEGSPITLSLNGRTASVKVSGFVETGRHEDISVILDLPQAQRLTGNENKLSAVLIRARSDTLDRTVTAVNALMPGMDVKTLRQVAYGEEAFLRKIELLMIVVTFVVTIACGISVSSTMASTVLERIKEIGLMKAIGGANATIRRLYLMEAGFIGITGGISGLALGFALAEAVSRGAFNSYINLPLYLVLLSPLIGLLIGVFSSAFPIMPALKQKPSEILRGGQ